MDKRTGGGSCYGIRNDGPELDFVGIGRNLKRIDNRRQLCHVSNYPNPTMYNRQR